MGRTQLRFIGLKTKMPIDCKSSRADPSGDAIETAARAHRAAARSTAAMPMLRRPHGRRRDLPRCRSTPCTTRLLRDDGVVRRRDQLRPLAGAVPLRPSGPCMPNATATAITGRMVPAPVRLPPENGPTSVLAVHPRPTSPVVRSALALPRPLRHGTKLLKSP
jgi:hypothetical protein